MSNRFDKIANKVEDIADKQRKIADDKKAKIKVTGRRLLGIKGKAKSRKSPPKSKVARGMHVLFAIIASVISLIAVNINVWPFNLFNGADREVGFGMKLVTFLIFAIPLYIVFSLLMQRSIKELEKKYGKQAW